MQNYIRIENNEYEIVSDYKGREELRKSFFELAKKTFGIDFEPWYRNGFWSEKYIPYSIVHGDKVVANVSVNHMYFQEGSGSVKRYLIQLGTIMTEEAYRNKGLIRELLEGIFEEYETRTEGIYLFGNDSVLNFYPMFGFEAALEYQYTKKVSITGNQTACKIPMDSTEDYNNFLERLRTYKAVGAFCMDNDNLLMFYLTSFLKDCVYYIEEIDTYVVAESEGGTLLLHGIFSAAGVEMEKVIQSFGEKISRVVLGFTPEYTDGFEVSVLKEEDSTLFVKGKGLRRFSEEKKMFPLISHA